MKTIRELREERGWTRLRLAVQLGVDPMTVYKWERRERPHTPSTAHLRALGRVLGVPTDAIALPALNGTDDASA